MRCSDARKTLSALLDAEGDAAARAAVAAHVDGCAACRGELEALAATDRALERAVADRARPPAGYHEGLWARIEAQLDGGAGQGQGWEMTDQADVRALAARALARATASTSVAIPEVMQAPAVLGQVVLPTKETRRGRPMLALGAAFVTAAAAAIGALVLLRGQTTSPVSVEYPPDRPAATAAPAAAPPPPAEPVEPPKPVVATEPSTTPPPEDKPRKPKKETPPMATAPATTTPPAAGAAPAEPQKPEKSAAEILDEMSQPPPTTAAPEDVAPSNDKLSHDRIKAGMSPFERQVQTCRSPGSTEARTVVVLRVEIQPDGKVASALPTGAHATTPVGACVAQKVQGAVFDAFDGPPMTIKYSFTLEPEE